MDNFEMSTRLPGETWRDDARCDDEHIDPNIFFEEVGSIIKLAKMVCEECIVRYECLDDALDSGDEYGVRGGLTASERRKLPPRKRYSTR